MVPSRRQAARPRGHSRPSSMVHDSRRQVDRNGLQLDLGRLIMSAVLGTTRESMAETKVDAR